jgi:hypothetical protein
MNKESIKELIFDGCDISHKDIIICDLRKHLPHRLNHSRAYQVHSKDFQEVYYDLGKAVDQFVSLVEARKKKI